MAQSLWIAGVQADRPLSTETIPARGIHSRDPSLRGLGLRLLGNLSKVARTHSAIASGSGFKTMVLRAPWCATAKTSRRNRLMVRCGLAGTGRTQSDGNLAVQASLHHRMRVALPAVTPQHRRR